MDIEAVKAWPVKKLKDGLWVLYAHHVLDELCLLEILHKLHENGEQVTRSFWMVSLGLLKLNGSSYSRKSA